MANIKIIVDGPLMDGHKLTFKAPCECTVVEYLDVRYVKDGAQASKLFTMKDTHGNDLTGIGNLFGADAYVSVVLNTHLGIAYLQNAATNGYLEKNFVKKANVANNFTTTKEGYVADARTVAKLNSNIVANKGKLVTIGNWSVAWTLNDVYANIGNKLSGSLDNQPYYEIGTGSDGYVKVLHSGLYFISMNGACYGVSSSSSGTYYARISKNGETVTNQKTIMQHYHYGSGGSKLNFSTVEWLDEGDVIRMEVSANLANNLRSDGKELLTLYKLA